MSQWKLNHLPNPLDLTVKTPDVLVSDDRYTLLLRSRLAHHLNDRRLGDLNRSVRTGPRCNDRDCAAEDAEEGHVSFNKGHVHEASLDKSNELFVHAQSDICRREYYRLRIFDFRFLDRDILV